MTPAEHGDEQFLDGLVLADDDAGQLSLDVPLGDPELDPPLPPGGPRPTLFP
jgi:hypothetical protein